MNTKPPFVVFGDEWGLHPTSVQYLARGLAQKYPLLYVNTFWQRRPRWNLNDARRAWHKFRLLTSSSSGNGSAPDTAGLYFYSPSVIPLKPVEAIRRCNRRMLVRGLQKQLRLHDFGAPVLFSALPFGAEAVGSLGERLLVYYIADQYAAMPDVYSDYVRKLEEIMLSEADLIFVTSRELQKEKSGRKASALLLPHGVDFEHFHAAADPPGAVPKELQNLPRPLLGFYGTLAPWVDADLLKQLSRAFPQASIVLIGPVWIDFPMPRDLSNLHWLGPVPYSDLPRYAAHFDVGLIPFRQDRLTAYVNPLKLLEYLALGLPVVSTPLPDLACFTDAVYQSTTSDDFIDQVALALDERTRERRIRRFTLAATESWEARVSTIEQHVQKALSRQPGTAGTLLPPASASFKSACLG